jgi:hypothetical protein
MQRSLAGKAGVCQYVLAFIMLILVIHNAEISLAVVAGPEEVRGNHPEGTPAKQRKQATKRKAVFYEDNQ